MYLLLPWQSHGPKHLTPLCVNRAHPASPPLPVLGKLAWVCAALLWGGLDSPEGWLVRGRTVGCGRGLASSQISAPSLLPVEACFETALPRELGTRVPIGAARSFPLGCLNSAWCFVLPAPSHPQKAAALVACASPAGPHGLGSAGPSWCQAEDCDSP